MEVAKSEVAGCSSRPFLTVKSLFLRAAPRNFRACGALLGGAARRGRLRRTPPSTSTPVTFAVAVATPGGVQHSFHA